MDIFQGVPINEHQLLLYYSFAPFLVVAELIAIGFGLYTLFGGRDKKAAQNRKNLEQRAKTDAVALARLEKIKRKTERKKKRNHNEQLWEIGFLSTTIVVVLLTIYIGIVQPVTDYIYKDYVVYTGEISVYRYAKHSRIILEDGTSVWGHGGLTEEDTYGTVIYTKRSKFVLGGKTE